MASSNRSTKTAQTNTSKQLSLLKDHVYTMVAAFAGVVFGVLGSLGFVSNMIRADFASETASLNHAIVSMAPTSNVTSACVAPASNSSAAKSAVTAKAAPAKHVVQAAGNQGNGGKGGGGGSFVSQLASGTIGGVNNNSLNTITATNINVTKVSNTNNVGVVNLNDQDAHSGKATVKDTSVGGSAASGTAQNQNDTDTNISIKN